MSGPDGECRPPVRLLEPIVAAIVDRIRGSGSVVPDLGCLAPTTDNRQGALSPEKAGRQEFSLYTLVTAESEAAACIERVIRSEELSIAGAEGEPSARVRALEERMPVIASGQPGLGVIDVLFGLVGHVRVQLGGFFGLLPFYHRLACAGLLRLRAGGSSQEGDNESSESNRFRLRPLRKPRMVSFFHGVTLAYSRERRRRGRPMARARLCLAKAYSHGRLLLCIFEG